MLVMMTAWSGDEDTCDSADAKRDDDDDYEHAEEDAEAAEH